MSLGAQLGEVGPPALFLHCALRSGLGLLHASTTALRGALAGGEAAVDLQELANKLEVFDRFQYAPAELGAAAGAALPLGEAVRRAMERGPFSALWLIEGMGHAAAEAAWRNGAPPRGLLSGLPAAGVPATAWVPLHTGMGLSLASRALRTAAAGDSPAAVRGALARLRELCAANSLPGYALVAFEGLGFVARNLYSQSVAAVDRQLRQLAPELVATFWHGVGRGLYFTPTRMFPAAAGAALAAAAGEPPHAIGRVAATAGVAWALTLVNLRQPEVLAAAVARHGGAWSPAQEAAVADGTASALAVWYDAAGNDPLLAAFLHHRPADPAAARLWPRLVTAPGRRALARHAALARTGRLEELFTYPRRSPG